MIHKFIKGSSDKTFVLLHGTGGNEYSLINVGKYLDPSYNILTVRGNVNENGANRFFKRKAEGVYDLESLFEEGENLSDFIVKSSKEYDFDLDKVILLGFSNGANIAMNLLLEHGDIYKKGILLAPMYPVDTKDSDLSDTSVFISSGKYDPMVSREESQNCRDLFTERDAEVTDAYVNGHEVTEELLDTVKEWL